MTIVLSIATIAAVTLLGLLGIARLVYTTPPNTVLIFSGPSRIVGGRRVGYTIVKGGRRIRRPLIERVDMLDLTNMTIDVSVVGAYSKGGIPLNVQGVANVKIAGHEPVLNNAIERFLGKSRTEIMEIARATLEGSLRGILATMTPEQVNDDKITFSERLVQEVEQDMTNLGLIIDTMKIQSVSDDVKYLDSIGRKHKAELICSARIAEATARADALVRAAENRQSQAETQIAAEMRTARAEADKSLAEIRTRRAAVVAEERSQVTAAVARAKADVEVQKARIEQVRRRLEADVIAPARAKCEAQEATARAQVAPIVEEGKARAEALRTLAASWKRAGENAREIFLLQKLEPILRSLVATIAETEVEKVTFIAPGSPDGSTMSRAVRAVEQIKEIFGIDIVEKLKALPDGAPASSP